MLLHLIHRTTFVYAGSAHDSFNEVRLRPVDDARQTCRRFDLRITPAGGAVRHFRDYYGNHVHYFDVGPAHQQLVVEAESEVATIAMPPPAVATDPALRPPDARDPYEQAEFLASSPFVPLPGDGWAEADAILSAAGRGDAWSDAVLLGRHVYQSIRYLPQSTTVSTLATDVLRSRSGVCQDFAHVLLGFCRFVGIPARYVSGYFFNDSRRPGEIEASHAWVEVWSPGQGWIGYDPTHERAVDERYVKVAVGRDYADIRPISGTYRGAGTQELRVDVAVRVVTGESAAPAA